MKVITLLENRTISPDYKCAHGLSLYVETAKHKILFDTGPNSHFIDNARKLGVKLEDVDIVIISHGHFDHGGGLEEFLKINDKAKVYIGKEAFDRHIVKLFRFFKYNIGLKKELSENERIIKVDGVLKIDDELTLFNGITESKLMPEGNKRLLKEDINGTAKPDDFNHEINLLVNEDGTYKMLCGCSHKGIVNIINKTKELINNNIKIVIGGFHLMRTKVKSSEGQKFLDELADILSSNDIEEYYTCHCTGEEVYQYLSEKMSNLSELKTGMTIQV